MKKYFAHKTATIEKEVKIGQGTKIWHNSQIRKGAQIGESCTIGHNCFIDSKTKIGKGAKLESNIDIWDLITLEDYVFVGPSAVFTNDRNPRAKYPKVRYPEYGKWLPTLVKEGATIGANSTIVCGNTIGRWAIVGAGAVVTNDVPDYAVVVGIPAKISGWACECGNKLKFKGKSAVCFFCKRKYIKRNLKVSEVK